MTVPLEVPLRRPPTPRLTPPTRAGRTGLTIIKTDNGVRIDYVVPLGPGEEAGLQEGDLIRKVDGHTTRTVPAVQKRWRKKPGQEVTLLVERDGEELEIVVTLGR